MTGSTGRSAAQLVAPSEEPRYFDDIGCLREYLKQSRTVAASAVVYVADHQTGDWVRADHAVYVHSASTSTPMGSHLLAYASEASRDADAMTGDRKTMSIADVFAGVPVPWSHEK
jgi:copper chaperone NosL